MKQANAFILLFSIFILFLCCARPIEKKNKYFFIKHIIIIPT